MAKKFAAVDGLHTIYSKLTKYIEGVQVEYYDIEGTTLNDLVNHNTICFVTADADDVDVYLAEHKILDGDKFIIVQNDIFSYYTNSENNFENTWRPIWVNNEELEDISKFSINYIDGTGTTVSSITDYTNGQLSIAYNVDFSEIVSEVINRITIPEVNNGELLFKTEKSTVHTDNTEDGQQPRDIEIDQNTIGFTCTHIEEVSTPDPSNPEQSISEEVEVEGEFTANTSTNSKVKIHYKGTADRVDWYKEGEQRTEINSNNTNAKKFVYIECLQDYFESSADFPYIVLKRESKDLISEDSIVFITCGSTISGSGADRKVLTDAEVFGNPEYIPGARFIWTNNKMFSANTWMPIFTRETEQSDLKGITPVIGTNSFGGRLIFQGAGGITVDNTINDDNTTGTHDRIITIDGSRINTGGTGSIGKIYDTQVYIKSPIPLGGTLVGQNALEENLFGGNVVPAEMTLHEVLTKLLYKEIPATPYFYGIVGPYADLVTFEQGQDYTSLFLDNTVENNNVTPTDVTSAFTKVEKRINAATNIKIYPANYYKTSGGVIPENLVDPHQYIIAAPKEYFYTDVVVGNSWLKVKADDAADVTSETGGRQIANWTDIKINDKDYYVWDLHSDLETAPLLEGTYYVTRFYNYNN